LSPTCSVNETLNPETVMKVKVVRVSDDFVLNVRYTDELIGQELADEAECDKAEAALKKVGRYYISSEVVLFLAQPGAVANLPSPRYFVMNGNTLGYVLDQAPHAFNVLHGSPLRGGHDWKNGPVTIDPSDKLIAATLADFDTFRVSPVGHIT
jgi:hypothetical protein